MKILTLNAGSSSLRLSLLLQTEAGLEKLAQAHLQDITSPDLSRLVDFIASANVGRIDLIVHRVVHGGAQLTRPTLIDAMVENEIEQLIHLAPLHNPPALEWIRLTRSLLGDQVPQVAVFDTAFYHALPAVAATYALPKSLCQQYQLRRYGFHGIAHGAMWNRWRELKPKIKSGGRVISVQLGSGCSITAIDQGEPVDTSMGFSPLEGLVMATRCGDLDPTVSAYLQQQAGLSLAQLEDLLNKQSGLLGISGESCDMQVLLNSDSPDAALAVDLYCYRVRKYIGAYLSVLGGADAILFGGGVGENSPQVRAKILQGMTWLGVKLDADANKHSLGKQTNVSTENSKISVWVIPVDEASVMVQQALEIMNDLPAKGAK